MLSKVVFVVGLVALVAGVGFFLMTDRAPVPGASDTSAGDAGDLKEALKKARKNSMELRWQAAQLQRQLRIAAATWRKTAPETAKISPEESEEKTAQKKAAPTVQALSEKLGCDWDKIAKFVARVVKIQKEHGPAGMEQFQQDPEFLSVMAEMMSAIAKLQREFSVSARDDTIALMIFPFMLERTCSELGVEFSPDQLEKFNLISSRLFEELTQANAMQTELEFEKTYEKVVSLSRFGSGLKDMLTEKQIGELGDLGEQLSRERFRQSMEMDLSVADADSVEIVNYWKGAFDITDQTPEGQLVGIANEYIAAYDYLKRRYPEDEDLTEQQKEAAQREVIEVEKRTLTSILQLELTDEQREKVRKYNPLDSYARMSLRRAGYRREIEPEAIERRLEELAAPEVIVEEIEVERELLKAQVERAYEEARRLYDDKKFEESIEKFEQVLEIIQSHPEYKDEKGYEEAAEFWIELARAEAAK